MASYSISSLGDGIFLQGECPISMVSPTSITKVSDTEIRFEFENCYVTITATSNDGETVKGLGYIKSEKG